MEHLLQNPLNWSILLILGCAAVILLLAGITEVVERYLKTKREREDVDVWKRIKEDFDKENRF